MEQIFSIIDTPVTIKKTPSKNTKIVLSVLIGFGVVLIGARTIFAAGDTQTDWTFANSGDYSYSDTSLVEVASSTARLRTRNYADDENTALLLHLDDGSGTTAVDSSSNSLTATITNPSWVTGNLNGGVNFNGSTSKISVPSDASISPSQDQSLEAWVKFDGTFDSTSHTYKQGIFDKGDYQLYFDNETGKLVYELRPAGTQTWEQVAGDNVNNTWDETGLDMFSAMAVNGATVYAGLGDAAGDAEVWMWDGSTWERIGGDGINNGWSTSTITVSSLLYSGGALYAGLGNNTGNAEVWRWNGSTWTIIGGDAVNSSWNGQDTVEEMVIYAGSLIAALGNDANEAEVWSFNGTDDWTQIGGDSLNNGWTTNFDLVSSLVADGTYLYAGLGLTADEAEVWRWNGSAWAKIGGDTANGSWGAGYEYVYTMLLDGSTLYAGLGTTTNDAEVWRWNGTSWAKIGGDGQDGSWNLDKEVVRSLAINGTTLYAGLGNGNGDSEVWQFASGSWSKIGGDGVNSGWDATSTEAEQLVFSGSTLYAGITETNDSAELWSWNGSSWTQLAGDGYNGSWGHYGIEYVRAMHTYKGNLYAGTGGGGAGEALVWKSDGTTWTQVGGGRLNNSWGDKIYERVNNMANVNGYLYIGMGATANVDQDVWQYDGSTWTQIGGDNLNSGWNTGYNEVLSLAGHGGALYAGLGTSTGDADVWRWNGSTWAKVGGDGAGGSWTNEEVTSLFSDGTLLYAGTGNGAGDAEVWTYNGTSWTKIGGDGDNSSWANSTFERVRDFAKYNGVLYVGIGDGTGEAEVWAWNGSSWTQEGGDGVKSSWNASYEVVESLTVYNGELYASLGTGIEDGEVWAFNGTTWTKVGGDSVNSSFDLNKEQIYDLTVYKGKLYAGTGNTGNADAEIWAYGNNATLASTTSAMDTNWHHIAATYDGSTMKIFIDGELDNSLNVAQFVNQGTVPLYIGSTHGSSQDDRNQGFFDGTLDEIRISDSARESFTTTPFATTAETIRPAAAVMTSQIKNWEDFVVSESPDGGTITYRLSSDGGATWKYYNSLWTTSNSTSEANSAAVINTNIDTFPVGSGGIMWQAILSGDGSQEVTLNSVTITATADTLPPSNPSLLTALSSSGGSAISSEESYSYAAPYFSWSGASDAGSGIGGYYVYFGVDETANPITAGTFQVGTSYTASGLINGTTYYLRIRSRDAAFNPSSTTWAPFIYTYSETPPTPTNVAYISTASGSFGNIADMGFSWPVTGSSASAPYAGGAEIVGWQYAINNTDDWLGTYTDADLGMDYIPIGYTQPYDFDVTRDGPYVIVGENTVYFRTVDADGITSDEATYRTGSIVYAGAAPTFAASCTLSTGITVTPSTSDTNSFALSWAAATPDDGQFVTNYYYMINTNPPTTLSTITSNTATYMDNGTERTVAADTLPAVVKGSNTVYVVAVDDIDNYSGSNCIKGVFTLNSTNPNPPETVSVTDASVKSTELWRAALAWAEPTYTGTGQLTYKIQRSEDGSTWEDVTTTTGTAYVDTVAESKPYYWRIGAYDTSSSSIASPTYANAVTLTPKGTFDEAPELSGDVTISTITTKKATVSWSTTRAADTKLQFGTKSGDYFDEEPSKSEQVIAHEILLDNLDPGTKYYVAAKWTDEDGNTGIAEEVTFETKPAPIVSEIKAQNVAITTATISFTVSGASKAKIYYGETTSFGGVTEIATSESEASYTITLSGLSDGTKYFYKINTFDSELDEYDGSVLDFTTLPRPQISEVRVQQVKGTAQPTVLVTWTTNTEVSSIITYYPDGNPGAALDEVNVALTSGEHRMIIRNLVPQTRYILQVSGRDIAGNEATSDNQNFTTATDTRAPLISGLKIEGTNVPSGNNNEQRSQLIVTWDTDEGATSQVEYGEGTGSAYSQKTQEDSNLTVNHLVIVSGLSPSKVYHLRVVSKDAIGNVTESIDTVTITPKASENALDLVIENLQEAFGFLGGF